VFRLFYCKSESYYVKVDNSIHNSGMQFHEFKEEWFRNQPATVEQIELTFGQVKAILEAPLPNSAKKLKTWWTNFEPKIQSHRTAWLNNGWKVAEFDQQAM
jgi:hypothetical protein